MKRRANGDGSLFLRKSTGKWEGRYHVFDEHGVAHTKAISGKTKMEVAKKLRQAIVESQTRTYNFQSCDTLESYAQHWKELMTKRQEMHPGDSNNYKLHTIATYTQALRRVLLPELGKRRINKITKKDIKQALQRVNDRFGNTRQCQISRNAISAIMKLAIEEDRISENPALGVVVPKYDTKEKEIWEKAELKSFIQAAKHDRLYPMFALMIECGLRRGEALGLRKVDCDLEKNLIFINQQVIVVENRVIITTPKTKTSCRAIPISESLSRILKGYIAKDVSNCELLFHSKNDTPISPRNFARTYKSIVERAKIRYLPPHSLRHSYCTDLCRSGVDIKTNQVLMGHADPSVTIRTYQHVNLEQKINAGEKLNNYRKLDFGITN